MKTPLECRRVENTGLQLTWPTGERTFLGSEILRRNCPCATCREKRGDETHARPLLGKKRSLTVLKHTRDEELDLARIWGVGNYALGLAWGDGHDTGIYTFEYLFELGAAKTLTDQNVG